MDEQKLIRGLNAGDRAALEPANRQHTHCVTAAAARTLVPNPPSASDIRGICCPTVLPGRGLEPPVFPEPHSQRQQPIYFLRMDHHSIKL